jgi:hypothetical protein
MTHTFKSITDETQRDPRTVRRWYEKACQHQGVTEFGTLINGTRHFTDDEKAAIMAFYVPITPTELQKPQSPTVEVGNHQIVLASPEMPQTYSIESLRSSEAVSFDDPLAVAQQFLTIADSLTQAMDADIRERESKLRLTRQAREQIDQKVNELKIKKQFYQTRTLLADQELTHETSQLQHSLEQVQTLGKPDSV